MYIVYLHGITGYKIKLKRFKQYSTALKYSIDFHTIFGCHKNSYLNSSIGDTFIEEC